MERVNKQEKGFEEVRQVFEDLRERIDYINKQKVKQYNASKSDNNNLNNAEVVDDSYQELICLPTPDDLSGNPI